MKNTEFKLGDKVRVIVQADFGDLKVGYEGFITCITPSGGCQLDGKEYGFVEGVSKGKLELITPALTPHIHQKEIIAWANGNVIEVYRDEKWHEVGHPIWNADSKYRVTPEEDPKSLKIKDIESKMRKLADELNKLSDVNSITEDSYE